MWLELKVVLCDGLWLALEIVLYRMECCLNWRLCCALAVLWLEREVGLRKMKTKMHASEHQVGVIRLPERQLSHRLLCCDPCWHNYDAPNAHVC